jgi:hypothetical protein
MIINYLLQSGWNIHAGEDSRIRVELNNYHNKVLAIRKGHVKQMTDELTAASKEGRELPQEFLKSIGSKYREKINSETYAYLQGKEGARFYDLSNRQRTEIMIRNVEEKARQGKKIVFWGGASHGAKMVLALREKGTPITLYSNVPDFNPETFQYTRKEFIKEVFGGIGEISFEE